MKLWELYSLLSRRGVREADLPSGDDWKVIRQWWHDMGAIIDRQDRAVLDHEVPDALAHAALGLITEPYWLEGRVLRSRPVGEHATRLSAVEAAQRFGGSALEEVEEFGSCEVRVEPETKNG